MGRRVLTIGSFVMLTLLRVEAQQQCTQYIANASNPDPYSVVGSATFATEGYTYGSCTLNIAVSQGQKKRHSAIPGDWVHIRLRMRRNLLPKHDHAEPERPWGFVHRDAHRGWTDTANGRERSAMGPGKLWLHRRMDAYSYSAV
jgi:hypothetical protein